MRRTSVSPGILLAAGFALAGCAAGGSTDARPLVVATTTMLGSVVGDIVACAGESADTLMPVGVDPHDFSASSEQVAQLIRAELVVANGLGLEEGLADAIASAEAEGAQVVEVAPLVDPIDFTGGRSADPTSGTSPDPHFWHDVSRMAEAAGLIGARLAGLTEDDAYDTCGSEIRDALMEADAEVRDILSVVPPERRSLITDHDAFGYFAEAYDFEIAGVVIPGGWTLAEPSSAELAALIDLIRVREVRAIFSDAADPSPLSEVVAAEAGAEVEVVELFVGSLGPDGSGAETYAGMQLTNARLIADALG